MIDVDTPAYLGYDPAVRGYRFRVTGRWLAACSGKYCWPATAPYEGDIGSNDAVKIRFSDAVQFKRFQIRAYDACGHKTYDKTATANYGSFLNAYAGLDDKTFESWRYTTMNGSTVINAGTCKLSALPSSGGGAGSSSGSGSYRIWDDLKAQRFTYDVWVNPAPSQGSCYDHLYVKAGYTHTWSTSGLAWSVGYPWGVGVGPVSGTSHFTVWQNQDGSRDDDLVSGSLCRH